MTRMSAVISCQFLVFSQGTKNPDLTEGRVVGVNPV